MALACVTIPAIASFSRTCPASLSSTRSFATAPPIHLARATCSVVPLTNVRASASELNSTRREILISVIGTGAALGFCGNAGAANPGTLGRQGRGESPALESKQEAEEGSEGGAGLSDVEEVETPTAESVTLPPQPEEVKATTDETASRPVEYSSAPALPEALNPLSAPDVSSPTVIPSSSESPEVPRLNFTAHSLVEPGKYEEYDLGAFFGNFYNELQKVLQLLGES